MDKFLYLVRQYLHASFRYLSRRDWSNTTAIDAYMSVLESTPLSPKDMKVPDGMRYHVLDIYADELEKVNANENANTPVEKLLQPLEILRADTLNKIVKQRATEALDDERVRKWRGLEPWSSGGEADEIRKEGVREESDVDDGGEWGGFDD
jgi:ribosomal RNA-processing protein 1